MSHGFARTKTLKGLAAIDASTGYVESALIAPVASVDAALLSNSSLTAQSPLSTLDKVLVFDASSGVSRYVLAGELMSYGLQVARGLVTGVSGLNKFGRAPAGVQTTPSDIWTRANSTPTQQIWLAPTAARIHAIVSTSTSDDGSPAGVGARTIRIYGLKTWADAETNEDITLNGTTPVNTANSYVIIHRMKVLTCGATNINVGTITATAATDNTVTAEIAIGQGQTQMAIYGVPSTKSFYMTRLYGHMNDSSSTVRIDMQLRSNENPDVQTTQFINKFDIQLMGSGSTNEDDIYDPPNKFAGPCILKVQATATAADVDLSAGFDGYLVTN